MKKRFFWGVGGSVCCLSLFSASDWHLVFTCKAHTVNSSTTHTVAVKLGQIWANGQTLCLHVRKAKGCTCICASMLQTTAMWPVEFDFFIYCSDTFFQTCVAHSFCTCMTVYYMLTLQQCHAEVVAGTACSSTTDVPPGTAGSSLCNTWILNTSTLRCQKCTITADTVLHSRTEKEHRGIINVSTVGTALYMTHDPWFLCSVLLF